MSKKDMSMNIKIKKRFVKQVRRRTHWEFCQFELSVHLSPCHVVVHSHCNSRIIISMLILPLTRKVQYRINSSHTNYVNVLLLRCLCKYWIIDRHLTKIWSWCFKIQIRQRHLTSIWSRELQIKIYSNIMHMVFRMRFRTFFQLFRL